MILFVLFMIFVGSWMALAFMIGYQIGSRSEKSRHKQPIQRSYVEYDFQQYPPYPQSRPR